MSITLFIFAFTTHHNMKKMIKTLAEAAQEQPLEFIGGVVTVASIFGLLYLGLWFAAAIA